MTSLLPGMVTRYVLTFIGAQIAMFLLLMAFDYMGWGDDIGRAGNVAVLLVAANTAGHFVAKQLGQKPSWGMSLKLSLLLSIISAVLAFLFLGLFLALDAELMAEMSALSDELGLGMIGGVLAIGGIVMAISFPVTIAGFRMGAGQMAKMLAKEAATPTAA